MGNASETARLYRYTDRKLHYGIKDDRPDTATLSRDIQSLAEIIKTIMESGHGRKISPVYQLLPNLQEPDWKSPRIGDVRDCWEQHDAWEDWIVFASKADHTGDVLVLADESPVAAFRAKAWICAGTTLRNSIKLFISNN